MTLADLQSAAPRQIEPGIVETGPFYERGSRGGYFTANGSAVHWYEEGGIAPDCCMSRDVALLVARDCLHPMLAEAA